MDDGCPNSRLHGPKHLVQKQFLRLLKHQLLVDTSTNASCLPLNIHGARGGLLKVCVAARGYTFFAKGSERHNLEHLRNEQRVYRQLEGAQGNHIPVCLGLLELKQVYHYSGARLSHLLLMSWGGSPLSDPLNRPYQALFPELAKTAMEARRSPAQRHGTAKYDLRCDVQAPDGSRL